MPLASERCLIHARHQAVFKDAAVFLADEQAHGMRRSRRDGQLSGSNGALAREARRADDKGCLVGRAFERGGRPASIVFFYIKSIGAMAASPF